MYKLEEGTGGRKTAANLIPLFYCCLNPQEGPLTADLPII